MIKLLFVGDFNALLSEKAEVLPSYGAILVANPAGPEEACAFLDRYDVDCAVLHLSSPTNLYYELIATATALRKKPSIIVINGMSEDIFGRKATELGAGAVLSSGCSLREIMETAKRLSTNNELSVKITKDGKSIDERLASIFIASGIPPHIKGYQYFREAVKAAMSAPEMINNITKVLYPTVAKKYNTTSSKVERAIRHAIDVAWSRGKIENINQIYGIKIFNKGDKPTNGELIALVSDKMIIECC